MNERVIYEILKEVQVKNFEYWFNVGAFTSMTLGFSYCLFTFGPAWMFWYTVFQLGRFVMRFVFELKSLRDRVVRYDPFLIWNICGMPIR